MSRISSISNANELYQKNKNTNPSFNNNTYRVVDIILDSNHPKFTEYGEWQSIGMIFYESVFNPNINTTNVAYPYYTNIIQYPLKNEIINIVFAQSINSQNELNNKFTAYYISPISVFNNVIDNALLNTTYKNNTSLGNYYNSQDNKTKKLRPYEGDTILQSRFGSSIRFSSTLNNSNIWNFGENSSPIIIINNGQYIDNSKKKWETFEENINKDLSSCYITSTQKIKIESKITKYDSFRENIIGLSDYNKPQFIFTTSRFLVNCSDNILLHSSNYINLNTLKSINIDTKEFIISSNKNYFGNKDAVQPILLGNDTLKFLNTFISEVINISDALSKLVGQPSGTPYSELNIIATKAAQKLKISSSKLNKLLSSKNYID